MFKSIDESYCIEGIDEVDGLAEKEIAELFRE